MERRKPRSCRCNLRATILANICTTHPKLLTRFVLEFLHSLHGAVVVVEVDGAHHLAALDVAYAQADPTNHVAAHQLHDLRRCREFRVNLEGNYLGYTVSFIYALVFRTP